MGIAWHGMTYHEQANLVQAETAPLAYPWATTAHSVLTPHKVRRVEPKSGTSCGGGGGTADAAKRWTPKMSHLPLL